MLARHWREFELSSLRELHFSAQACKYIELGMLNMSRKRFCQGACAVGTQLLFELNGFSASSRISEWQFPCLKDNGGEIDFDLSGYGASDYRAEVLKDGIARTWERICKWLLNRGETAFLKIGALGELYEEGLAIQDKSNKKASGQYYTPEDVSLVMAKWFLDVPGDGICDVGCGVGNLILAYLSVLGEPKARRLIKSGKVYLYDLDETALSICLTSLALRYGREAARRVHAVKGDFLDRSVTLPKNCKVISNPPYAAVSSIPETWNRSETVVKGKELYSAFMEKILLQSRSSVIITPYSFIGADKFYPLRQLMSERSGFVVAFDNVPGMIFIGRKHGIFNTNTGNSVRAAITVVDGDEEKKGFRISPLIRFKNSERQSLLNCEVLEGMLGTCRQTVSPGHPMFAKCDKRLEAIHQAWVQKSNSRIGLHISNVGKHELFMPNTCRYFTVATNEPLSRKGQITLRFLDADAYWYVFCLINSSFAYWHWRMYDGGITYPRGLLLNMPSFFESLTASDRQFCREISREMIERRAEFVVRKSNVGVQENVKYPRDFRDRINRRFLRILGVNGDESIFDIVHSNMALEVNLCETKSI